MKLPIIGPVLRFIGGVGKGFATAASGAVGVGGLALGGGDQVAACLTMLMEQPDTTMVVLGIAGVIFGIARKGGWIAAGAKK